ncbi:PilZ domain-containing protein [Nitrospiraceae bacterium AH_259_D15_M11_P09]|nr:PilZ domain-containing protein [Nitrospiraceae bacterium AH_259_D15_M11_P09]
MSDQQCPKCGKDFVRRALCVGVAERLLSLCYLYPYRCQLCAHRFRLFEWGRRYDERTVDQRQYERIEVQIPATFSMDQASGTGLVTSLSLGGCALEVETQLSVGALLQLQLQVSGSDPPIEVEAAIVRSVRAKNFGMEFLRLRSDEHYRLIHYVAGLLIANRQ